MPWSFGHERLDRGIGVDVEVRPRDLHLLHVLLEDGPALLRAQLPDLNVFSAIAAREPDRARGARVLRPVALPVGRDDVPARGVLDDPNRRVVLATGLPAARRDDVAVGRSLAAREHAPEHHVDRLLEGTEAVPAHAPILRPTGRVS